MDTQARADLLSHVGLARELAALFGVSFEPLAPDAPARLAQASITRFDVVVEAPQRCPQYGALAVDDVAIGPAPLWLRCRLSTLGLRAISSIDDVASLVMLEYGHPVEVFDLDQVEGGRLVVRLANAGESLQTGTETLHLDGEDLVVADARGPLSLAGIVAGCRGRAGSGTKRILLGCAYYAPAEIRRTAARHALRSEASIRFERGVDRNDAPEVLAHAGALATRLAGGAAVPGAVHVAHEPFIPRHLELSQQLLANRWAGELSLERAWDALQRLGFMVTPLHGQADASIQVEVPSFRPLVDTQADLVEEVARVLGR